MDEADLILVLRDSLDPEPFPNVPADKSALYILSKADLVEGRDVGEADLYLSVRTGQGYDSLTKRILEEVEQRIGSSQSLTTVRHRQVSHLMEAIEKIEETARLRTTPLEIRAEILRGAAHSLGKITGGVDVEGLLDVIFSEFCIGK